MMRLMPLPLVSSLVLLLVGVAQGGTITTEAFGSDSPPIVFTVQKADTASNGDFTLSTLNGAPSPLGDGEDDWTSWTFDFTAVPGFATFPSGGDLSTALLTLTLTPKEANVGSDVVWMDGLPAIGTPVIQQLTVAGGKKTVSLDLLDFYSSSDILAVLSGGGGLLSMTYHDDAIVSYARLELTAVPLPGAAWMGLGLLAAMALGLRRRAGR